MLGGRLWHAPCQEASHDISEQIPLSFPSSERPPRRRMASRLGPLRRGNRPHTRVPRSSLAAPQLFQLPLAADRPAGARCCQPRPRPDLTLASLPSFLFFLSTCAAVDDYVCTFEPLVLEEAREGLKADWAESCAAGGRGWAVEVAR